MMPGVPLHFQAAYPATEAVTVIPAGSVPMILAHDTADILGTLKRELDALDCDASTPAGRKRIISAAQKVATSKMDLVRLANTMVEDDRKRIAAIVAERKVIEDRMDALKAEVRAPVTEWENVEKRRVAGHEAALAELESFAVIPDGWPSGHIQTRIDEFHRNRSSNRDWQEFTARASHIVAEVNDKLSARLLAALRQEAEAEELAQLRAAEAERARLVEEQAKADREARIAAEAAEAARIEAERVASAAAQRAEAERLRIIREAEEAAANAERREREAKAEAERSKRETAEALERARLAEERAETDRIAAAEAAKAAEKAAEAEAERRAKEATETEQRRQRDQEAAEKAENDRRAADVAHRTAINRAIVAALAKIGASQELSRAIVIAIAKGEIPSIAILY